MTPISDDGQGGQPQTIESEGLRMSYWVALVKEGERVTVPHFEAEGGTYVVGGSTEARLNVTYNYSEIWSVRTIDGLTGADSIPLLEEQVHQLGTQQYRDYWAPTKGNVGYMCSILLAWARRHPTAIWEVD